jgi:hypothetical protein
MEKEFIPYEQALKLKELGFDEPCFGFHSKIHGLMMVKTSGSSSLYKDAGECLAPTYSQAFRWFRENYNLISSIDTIIYGCTLNEQEFHYKIITNTGVGSYGQFGTYEEAELECLKKLLEIVKEK